MKSTLKWLSTALGALLALSSAQAITLDWSAVTWSPGSLSNSYDIDPSSPGTDITITFSGDTGTLTTQNSNGTGSQTPVVDSTMEGGLSTVTPSLDIAANLHTNDRVTVTITFSAQYAKGVEGVTFTLFDIDRQTNDDEIHSIYGTAFGTGTQLAGIASNVGSSITPSGSGLGLVLDGTSPAANNGPNSSNGNATISFGSYTALSGFSFTFQNSSGAPRFQQIALNNLSFSPVPEMNPALAATVACLAAFVVRRSKTARQSPGTRRLLTSLKPNSSCEPIRRKLVYLAIAVVEVRKIWAPRAR